ncbi:hypothetical protein DCAR_0415285 [Daucus carota subsp. sativus]|uniref:Uncharacterized protein n=1 Tax=Daucus carota subsp. sativus TaxID=79200 RepID=A0AAF1AXG2_DAUCS|nr:hypothetical protein DCAR_0415285 [Daucus carota subsp. sativus]
MLLNSTSILLCKKAQQTARLRDPSRDIFRITSGLCIFANLQKPQVELDGKACAAAGQNSLMALYDLDVTSSQLLVTDNDFKNADYRVQLGQIVNSLIALRSIQIFNENDAISTRTAPYEVKKEGFMLHIVKSIGVIGM